MTLQSSGAISLSDVQTEFTGSNPISISEYYGVGTVPASGTISLNDFYGTSNEVYKTISSNTLNAVASSYFSSNERNSKCFLTIDAGIYCYSNSTGLNGMTVDNSFPAGLTLIVNGSIRGKGGRGGVGRGGDGGRGGVALRNLLPGLKVDNNGSILGGGGGGGGGGGAYIGIPDYAQCRCTGYTRGPQGGTGGEGGARSSGSITTGAAGGNVSIYARSGAGGAGGAWGANGSNGQAGSRLGNGNCAYVPDYYPGGSGGTKGANTSGSTITYI